MTRIFARAYAFGAGHDPEVLKKQLQATSGKWMVQTLKDGASDNELFVEMLAAQTLRAQAQGSLLARRPEVDFILRMAGTTQISQAIRQKGAHRGRPFLLVVAGSSDPRGVGGRGASRLPRRELTRDELGRIEEAALLSTKRP